MDLLISLVRHVGFVLLPTLGISLERPNGAPVLYSWADFSGIPVQAGFTTGHVNLTASRLSAVSLSGASLMVRATNFEFSFADSHVSYVRRY